MTPSPHGGRSSGGADLIRTRAGALHVIYADHVLIDSDLSGFAYAEMEGTREEKAARVAGAAAEIAAAAGDDPRNK